MMCKEGFIIRYKNMKKKITHKKIIPRLRSQNCRLFKVKIKKKLSKNSYICKLI